jgi:hypothetical protein
MSDDPAIHVVGAVLSGGRLRLVAELVGAETGFAVDAEVTITDFFGATYPATMIPTRAAEAWLPDVIPPGAVVIEAVLPPIPPDADAPSYLLSVSGLSTWFAPASQDTLAGAASEAALSLPPGSTSIDYTGRDYAAFTAMMRSRIAKSLGADSTRALDHPSDPLTTLTEVLAYAGDHLSFRQDAAGTESYLTTARRRLSLRRHGRLRDYAVDDGCAARTVLVFTVKQDDLLPGGLAAVTYQPGRRDVVLPPGTMLAPSTTVFETMAPLAVHVELNDLGSALARPAAYTLLAGTISCMLSGAAATLAPGQLLVLRQTKPPAGVATPFGAQVLRLIKIVATSDGLGNPLTLIAWHPEDALARPLTVPPAKQPGTVSLFGNVALADHGATVAAAPVPDIVPDAGPYRPFVTVADPLLAAPPPAIAAGYDGTQDLIAASLLVVSARASLKPDPRGARVGIEMTGERPGMTIGTPPDATAVTDLWTPQPDLLSTPATGRSFAVSLEDAVGSGPRRLSLRFGAAQAEPGAGAGPGYAPAAGTRFTAAVRDGGGQTGRVNADALLQLVGSASSISSVTNPVAAAAPAPAEQSAAVRLFAQNAFRTNLRGVDPGDWELLGQRDPLVTAIRASSSSTKAGGPCDIGLATTAPQAVSYMVAATRLLDHEVLGAPPRIRPATGLPLDIALVVYCRPGTDAATARARLLQRLGSNALPDGSPAFFNPANWPLGKPVKLADLVDVLEADCAVSSVLTQPRIDPRVRFKSFAGPDVTADNIANGFIPVGPAESARVSNDSLRPQDGSLRLLIVITP